MAIKRDVKTLARRLDRRYIDRQSAIRRLRVGAIVLCCVMALGWWALNGGATEGELYNPGPVAAVHASIQNNCMACHTGDGPGKFSKAVTDTACLSCHDGSIHHPNQKMLEAHAKLDRNGTTLAVTDSTHPFGMRSGSCVSCHTEHRGPVHIKGASDQNCTVCHANVKLASTSEPQSANRVVAFNAADHPDFGRTLTKEVDGQKRLFDPTMLQFNHRKHLSLDQFKNADSCIRCHEATGIPSTQPAMAGGDGRYLQPISFDKHCLSCHAVSAPSVVLQTKRGPRVTNENLIAETTVPHVAMDQVYAFASTHVAKETDLKNLPDLKARQEFMMKAAGKIQSDLSKQKLRDGAWKGTPPQFNVPTTMPVNGEQWWLAQSYAAAIATNAKGCVLCHSLDGSQSLQTVPTGIPDSPRRWFSASEFDHRKHRNMSCVECHTSFSLEKLASVKDETKVPQLEETSFFSSPGMSWQQTIKTGDTFTAKTRSCVECHHADTGTTRGVASDCVSCHVYHDRVKEKK